MCQAGKLYVLGNSTAQHRAAAEAAVGWASEKDGDVATKLQVMLI